ncbi:MAG: DUF4149 domain-containing protein [Halobacteriovoraceae bacterium]|jgi:hypothetical protein|nr:DUF4149 domain-containing protein [Halobacteriovoraceae bacterium]MBT5095581.1 DUF4149 domain-containing protein [Halobacteriovoraceae bacterium]
MKFTHFKSIALIFVSSWFSMTCLIDFLAVPLLFRNVPDAEIAGKIGMKIFSTFNSLELGFGMASLILVYLMTKGRIKHRGTIITLFALALSTLISVAYIIKITPAVGEYANQMHQHVEESKEYKSAEEIHQFYHHLYVKLDAAKLILLLIVLVGLVSREDPELLAGHS